MSTNDSDGWGLCAPIYIQVERLTAPPCQSLLNRVSTRLPLDGPNTSAFDNGCGTGVLATILKQQHPQLPLLATDASDGMIATVQRRIEHQKWTNVTARVVDGRDLAGLHDGSFTHVFSTFMVCLAPEPEKIVREMRRVMKRGGVLGLAVWGEPRFRCLSAPWEQACRSFVPDFEVPTVMDAEWTFAGNVEAGLCRAGFQDVEVWEEDVPWRWDSAEAMSKYFFDGGNPANLKMINAFKARGGDVDEARRIFDGLIKGESGREDGSIELRVSVTLAMACK